jgi:hypothetical protein
MCILYDKTTLKNLREYVTNSKNREGRNFEKQKDSRLQTYTWMFGGILNLSQVIIHFHTR